MKKSLGFEIKRQCAQIYIYMSWFHTVQKMYLVDLTPACSIELIDMIYIYMI